MKAEEAIDRLAHVVGKLAAWLQPQLGDVGVTAILRDIEEIRNGLRTLPPPRADGEGWGR